MNRRNDCTIIPRRDWRHGGVTVCIALVTLLTACSTERQASAGASGAAGDIIKVTGELRSAHSRFFGPPPVASMWRYTISALAEDGMKVRQGQVILAFDTQDLEMKLRDKNSTLNQKQKELQKQEIVARETLAELRLSIEEARAAMDKAALKADIPETLLALRDYKEYQLLLQLAELTLSLRKEELGKEMRIQETEAKILKREIAVLDAEIAQFEASIKAITIRAPTDGVVIHVVNHHNNKVAIGENVWGGRRVIELPDLAQLELHLEIPERESARVTVGQTVRFTLDAAPDQPFVGEVVELASVIHTKSINQPARVYDATVALRNADPDLMRPGMSVNAEMHISGATLAASLQGRETAEQSRPGGGQ